MHLPTKEKDVGSNPTSTAKKNYVMVASSIGKTLFLQDSEESSILSATTIIRYYRIIRINNDKNKWSGLTTEFYLMFNDAELIFFNP